jgi:hypothetical protein
MLETQFKFHSVVNYSLAVMYAFAVPVLGAQAFHWYSTEAITLGISSLQISARRKLSSPFLNDGHRDSIWSKFVPFWYALKGRLRSTLLTRGLTRRRLRRRRKGLRLLLRNALICGTVDGVKEFRIFIQVERCFYASRNIKFFFLSLVSSIHL